MERTERPTDSGPGAPFPPTLIYIAGFLFGWWLETHTPLSPDWRSPVAVAVAGWGLVAFGVLLFVWGLATFSKVRTGIMFHEPATRVVDVPPYSWSRNPMYVAFTAIYVGLALVLQVWWPFVVLPLVVGVLTLAVIAREERYMRATFGAAYDDYCRRVRRWI
jgi:protein-S-isoprenylcysteine O-methyltransferase Ste14